MSERLEDQLWRQAAKSRQAVTQSPASLRREVCAEPAAEGEHLALDLAAHFLRGKELTARACIRLKDQVRLPASRECRSAKPARRMWWTG